MMASVSVEDLVIKYLSDYQIKYFLIYGAKYISSTEIFLKVSFWLLLFT